MHYTGIKIKFEPVYSNGTILKIFVQQRKKQVLKYSCLEYFKLVRVQPTRYLVTKWFGCILRDMNISQKTNILDEYNTSNARHNLVYTNVSTNHIPTAIGVFCLLSSTLELTTC